MKRSRGLMTVSSSKSGRVAVFLGVFAVDLGELVHLETAVAAAHLAFDPLAVAQSEAAHHFGRHEDILRALHEIPLGIAQETEALAGDLDDAFGEDGLLVRLLGGGLVVVLVTGGAAIIAPRSLPLSRSRSL